MNEIVKSSTFKSGNSVAVRLPKTLGVGPGEEIELERRGDTIQMKIVSEAENWPAKFAEFAKKMRELGPIGGDPNDGRIEFPDRPGLY